MTFAQVLATTAPKTEVVQPLIFAIALGLIALITALITYRAVVAVAANGADGQPWGLLKTFPSTNGRIVIELGLAVIYVIGCMGADMIGRPVSDSTQNTLGLFIAAMLGIGAGQFFGKRKTEADYVAAKNGGPGNTTTNVVSADVANVEVKPATPAAPTVPPKPE